MQCQGFWWRGSMEVAGKVTLAGAVTIQAGMPAPNALKAPGSCYTGAGMTCNALALHIMSWVAVLHGDGWWGCLHRR